MVDPFEDPRVVIQGLHDRQPDSANVLECFLRRGLTPGGIIPEVTQELLEARVRLSPFLIGTTAVGAHLETVGAHLETEVA